tara:strand:+ start:34791 stop:35231 length:441 start_codon:yes stop_codon:yes gene_type:complete
MDKKQNLNLTEKEILKKAKEQGFDTDTIWYHVSNENFDTFDLEKSKCGTIWLTKDLDSIYNGETGASLNGDDLYIHKFYVRANKIGGWYEEDKYFMDQLIQDGYDALLLDDNLRIFNPNNIMKIGCEVKEINKPSKKEKNKKRIKP